MISSDEKAETHLTIKVAESDCESDFPPFFIVHCTNGFNQKRDRWQRFGRIATTAARREIRTNSMVDPVWGNVLGFTGLGFRARVRFRQFSSRQICTSADLHIRILPVADMHVLTQLHSSYRSIQLR